MHHISCSTNCAIAVAHNEQHRSQELSDIEIDGKLAEFFKDNSCITTQQLCSLCGLRKATALRRLQKRVAEGKLSHPGYLRSPFYFPVPGWFGISRNIVNAK